MQTGEVTAFEQDTPRRWRFAWCEYVELSRQLYVNGAPVKMEAKPLDVLQVLLENPKRALSKDELIGGAWNDSTSDESLATAIGKLRKAFGGHRDAVILNVWKIGYRMAVPVVCDVDTNTDLPPFHLSPGDPIPGCPLWKAVKPLGMGRPPLVWLGEHATRRQNVFKFATDGVRLRALQQEVTVSRLLQHDLPRDSRFVHIAHWQLAQPPFSIRSEYFGQNLLEWGTSPDFASLNLEQRISVAAEISEAVAAAHSIGILHNDLKPSNVLVLSLPGECPAWQIRISDFGIASVSRPQRLRELQITQHDGSETVEQPSSPLGTAMYVAPELATGGPPSVQADVYALGVMLYQIASGDFLEPPLPGWERRIPDPLLQQDISDAAHIDPKFRMQNAAELASRLRTIEERRQQQLARHREMEQHRHAQELLAAQRSRRRRLIAAISALSIGLCTSLVFFFGALRARDESRKQAETLASVYDFLSRDVLQQANPLAGSPASQTLLQAIDTAAAQIDRRFHNRPEIAARLHETLADAFRNRTQFTEANQQYLLAAKCFRRAESPASQAAIVADLKRESTLVSSVRPGSLEEATLSFRQTQRLVSGLPDPEPEVRSWYALADASLLYSGPHPQEAIPILTAAIDYAKKHPGSDVRTVNTLEQQLCFSYLKSGDPINAEKTARSLVLNVLKSDGPDSPTLIKPEIVLQEALLAAGKFKEAIVETTKNYPQFASQLGPANLYTLQTLATRAAAEGELKDYDGAIRDDLAVHDAAVADPSDQLFQIGTLADAATSECRMGRFSSGVEHAREALREAQVPGTRDALVSGSAVALAECLLSDFEIERKNPTYLDQAANLLRSVNTGSLGHFSANPGIEGNVDVDEARLSIDRGRYSEARQWAVKAYPFFDAPSAEAYEKQQLQRVNQQLQQPTHAK